MASILSIVHNDLLGVNITYSDILYGISFYLIIIEKLSRKEKIAYFFQGYSILWSILLFIGVGAFLSLSRTTEIFNSLSTYLQYIFIFVVLLSVVHYLVNQSIQNAIKVIGIWVIPYMITSMVVVLSKIGILTTFDSVIVAGSGRYQGFYGISTALGINLTLGLIGMAFFWRISKKKFKIIWILAISATLYSILLSGSFGSIIMSLITLILIGYYCARRKVFMRILIGAFLLCAATVFVLKETSSYFNLLIKYAPEILQTRLERSDGELGSFSLRMELNRMGLREFIRSPLVGVGFDQFRIHNIYNSNIHNTIIAAAVETGIIGLIGVLMYLLAPIIYGHRLMSLPWERFSKEYYFIRYMFVYTLIRLGQTMISGPYVRREQWVPVLTLFAIYAYEKWKRRRTRAEESLPDIYHRNLPTTA